MDATLVLDRLAVHYVNKKENRVEIAPAEQDVGKLDPYVIEFLLKMVHEVWSSEDTGQNSQGAMANCAHRGK